MYGNASKSECAWVGDGTDDWEGRMSAGAAHGYSRPLALGFFLVLALVFGVIVTYQLGRSIQIM